LDEIGDFGRMKNDILDNIFLVSLDMGKNITSVLQQRYKSCRHLKWIISTLYPGIQQHM